MNEKRVIVLERRPGGGFYVKENGNPLEDSSFSDLNDGFEVLRKISSARTWRKQEYLDGIHQLVTFSMQDTENSVRRRAV